MTFLEMVAQLHRDVGGAGVVPAAVTSQTGEANRLVQWVILADNMIQTLWHDWKFLRTAFTVNSVNSTQALVVPSTVGRWDYNTFMTAPVGSAVYEPIEAVEYQEIKKEFIETAAASDATPSRVIVMPNNALFLDPVPDGIYPFKADYFVQPTLLAANGDVSAIPIAFHYPVIVGRAMILYGNHENAQEMVDQGRQLYEEYLPRLESLQLPNQMDSRFTASGNSFEVIAE
jgi:hypothetical protein